MNDENNTKENLDIQRLVVALRTARTVTGWSQGEFADRFDLSQSAVARMERSETDISFLLFNRIAREYKKLGINIDSVFSDNLNIIVEDRALNLSNGSTHER
jgi:transcriptional regulator with XRE-family HTH domain